MSLLDLPLHVEMCNFDNTERRIRFYLNRGADRLCFTDAVKNDMERGKHMLADSTLEFANDDHEDISELGTG